MYPCILFISTYLLRVSMMNRSRYAGYVGLEVGLLGVGWLAISFSRVARTYSNVII